MRNTVLSTGVKWLGPTKPYRFWIESQKVGNSNKIKPIPIGALNEWPKLQFYATMMSWVWVWLDLRLFTFHFSDKVLLNTWNLRKCG